MYRHARQSCAVKKKNDNDNNIQEKIAKIEAENERLHELVITTHQNAMDSIKKIIASQKGDNAEKELVNDTRRDVQYVYLLQEREFATKEENVYKLGKSKQKNVARFRQYPKGSVLHAQFTCTDCTLIEKLMMCEFKERFVQRADIGAEYFEGDCDEMVDVIYGIVSKYKNIESPANNVTEINQTDEGSI